MAGKGFSLAENNTKVVVLAGRWRIRPIGFRLGGYNVFLEPAAKYLGVWLDKGSTFKRHVEEVLIRGKRMVNACLMVNTGGPRTSRGRLFAGVYHSVISKFRNLQNSLINFSKLVTKLENFSIKSLF